jgi:hypothetical protein
MQQTVGAHIPLVSLVEFKLAKSLFSSTTDDSLLDPSTLEELVIAASREYYDNAESGNLRTRDMKMAYDWYVTSYCKTQENRA